MSEPAKRFRVAFSFSGEVRQFVEQVAQKLAAIMGSERILYDKFHEAEFARSNLGIYLPKLYFEQSELIVLVISKSYDVKPWTGLEWTAIHALVAERKHAEVMLCRFDHAKVEGLYENMAGFVELDGRTPDEAARLILQRLAFNEGMPEDYYPDPKAAALEASAALHTLEAAQKKAPDAPAPVRDRIYISYRHVDKRWHAALRAELDADADLRDLIWDDTKLHAGSALSVAITANLARARVMLMLTSEDYFAPESGTVRSGEVKAALEGHAAGVLTILWLPVRVHNFAATPVADITAATGAGAKALEALSPEGVATALHLVNAAVRKSLKLPALPDKEAPASPPGKRTLVLMVHGIRTQAEWQGRIRSLIEASGDAIVVPLGYEYFNVFQFLCPFGTRQGPLRTITDEVRTALDDNKGRYDKVVYVGHSFGTWIFVRMLRENPDIKIARALLCGSVVAPGFRWAQLPNCPPSTANGLPGILNEAGSRDIWPIMARSMTWGFGPSGTYGFLKARVRDRFHNTTHSDYFKEGFAEKYWLPWIYSGTYVPTEYEAGVRPATPFLKNLLNIIHIKYVVIAAALAMVYFLWLRPDKTDGDTGDGDAGRPPVTGTTPAQPAQWHYVDPAAVRQGHPLYGVRNLIAGDPLAGLPLKKEELAELRNGYIPQQQHVCYLSDRLSPAPQAARISLQDKMHDHYLMAVQVLHPSGETLLPVHAVTTGTLYYPGESGLPAGTPYFQFLVFLFPLSPTGDNLLGTSAAPFINLAIVQPP